VAVAEQAPPQLEFVGAFPQDEIEGAIHVAAL
jgi:hypothetical protein